MKEWLRYSLSFEPREGEPFISQTVVQGSKCCDKSREFPSYYNLTPTEVGKPDLFQVIESRKRLTTGSKEAKPAVSSVGVGRGGGIRT